MAQETFYLESSSNIPFKKHLYGKNVFLIDDIYASTVLAHLSTHDCKLPVLTVQIKKLYQLLLNYVFNNSFEKNITEFKTRMHDFHPEGIYKGMVLDTNNPVVTVDLARAGMIPSQVIFEELSYLFPIEKIRQDHFYAARMTNLNEKVTGVDISGSKIGGNIEGAFVLFPDPMGATGNTISEALKVYKKSVEGNAKKFITLHLIITPEYIKRIQKDHPEVEIYALRLDRGLSSPKALASLPGEYPEEEKGLNNKDYIVPGAGGVGELLNNSFV